MRTRVCEQLDIEIKEDFFNYNRSQKLMCCLTPTDFQCYKCSIIKIGKNAMYKIWDRKSFEVGGHWPLWR